MGDFSTGYSKIWITCVELYITLSLKISVYHYVMLEMFLYLKIMFCLRESCFEILHFYLSLFLMILTSLTFFLDCYLPGFYA